MAERCNKLRLLGQALGCYLEARAEEVPMTGSSRPELSVVLGMWPERDPLEALTTAGLADRFGYAGLWIGEMATFDAFALATAVGLQTERIRLTVGPLAVAVRTPLTMATGAASVAALTGRGVDLAIGSSSPRVVQDWHGRPPTGGPAHLEETVRVLRTLVAGGTTDATGRHARSTGARLRLPADGTTVTVAGFGPRAVAVAGRHADRLVLTTTPPAIAARYRRDLDAAATAAGRPAPRLAVWLFTAVDPTPTDRTQLARAKVPYLATPGYRDVFTEAGFGDLVAMAERSPHPRELLTAVPDALVETFDLVGDQGAVLDRLAAYDAAGVDEVGILPTTAGDPGGARSLGALAPARLPVGP
jgi:probable F420-dependent oxidoreductase